MLKTMMRDYGSIRKSSFNVSKTKTVLPFPEEPDRSLRVLCAIAGEFESI
jgi:hypothetical protein